MHQQPADENESEDGNERRFDLDLLAQMKFVAEGGRLEAMDFLTRDVTTGGAFLHTANPLPLNTEVEMDLIFPLDHLHLAQDAQAKKVHIRVSGLVVRATPHGMGVRFDEGYHIAPWGESDCPTGPHPE
jgi:hypothetical protein